MPKFKTHSGSAKRIKISGSGRMRRQKAGTRHLLEKKSSRVTRRLAGTTDVSSADRKRLRSLLGR